MSLMAAQLQLYLLMKTELELIREQIDRIDDQLFDLILERCAKSLDAARVKGEHTIDSKREDEILEGISQKAERLGIDSDSLVGVYRELLKLSQKCQIASDR